MGTIIDTDEIAQAKSDGSDEPVEAISSMDATTEPAPTGISFHVQMRGYTQEDMEELIVEAAARIIVGRSGETRIAKAIEARVVEAIRERADAVVGKIAADVMNHTLQGATTWQASPGTVGQVLGMLGREYLEQKVTDDGKPFDNVSHWRKDAMTRAEYIARQHVSQTFAKELDAASREVVKEMTKAVKDRFAAMLDAKKAEFNADLAESFAKATK